MRASCPAQSEAPPKQRLPTASKSTRRRRACSDSPKTSCHAPACIARRTLWRSTSQPRRPRLQFDHHDLPSSIDRPYSFNMALVSLEGAQPTVFLVAPLRLQELQLAHQSLALIPPDLALTTPSCRASTSGFTSLRLAWSCTLAALWATSASFAASIAEQSPTPRAEVSPSSCPAGSNRGPPEATAQLGRA